MEKTITPDKTGDVAPPAHRWLGYSLGLQLLWLQGLVLLAGLDLAAFFNELPAGYVLAWVGLSLALAGAVGRSASHLLGSGRGFSRGWLWLTFASLVGLAASADPGQVWSWPPGMNLSAYPLAGLELKSLAALVALSATLDHAPQEVGPEQRGANTPADSPPVTRRWLMPASASAVLALSLMLLPAANLARLLPSSSGPGTEAGPGEWAAPAPRAYLLPVTLDGIAPALIEAGAIDPARLEAYFRETGEPLGQDELRILAGTKVRDIEITPQNARFLLDFFWALGLTNWNTLLTEGPIQMASEGDVGRYASTGGWQLGTRPGAELLASRRIVELTAEQQARVEAVSADLYRPCCNNPTSFPDCNHGMAMLGLLELMAAQGASEEDMWQAAKYVSAFWFPEQTAEVAYLFHAAENVAFEELDGQQMLAPAVFSGSGFRQVHAWLQENGLLEGRPAGGASCGA